LKSKKTKRLSREEWLLLALEALAKEGQAMLRVDRLSKKLGVTKGSFYWHFKGRDDFVMALPDYWSTEFTKRVVKEIDRVKGDAEHRLFELMKLLNKEKLVRYDVAVRGWASQEPKVAKVVKKVDEQRLSYIRSIFADMGFRGRQLEMRTRIFVVFHSMELGLFDRGTEEKRYKLLKLRHKFFTRP